MPHSYIIEYATPFTKYVNGEFYPSKSFSDKKDRKTAEELYIYKNTTLSKREQMVFKNNITELYGKPNYVHINKVGRILYSNDELYHGPLTTNSVISGRSGQYYYHSKQGYYIGEWKNGKKIGLGSLVYLNFKRNLGIGFVHSISGEFIDNNLNGNSLVQIRFRNGCLFAGNLKGDTTDNLIPLIEPLTNNFLFFDFDGTGMILYKNNEINAFTGYYDGPISKGKKTGNGQTFHNNIIRSGQFVKDLLDSSVVGPDGQAALIINLETINKYKANPFKIFRRNRILDPRFLRYAKVWMDFKIRLEIKAHEPYHIQLSLKTPYGSTTKMERNDRHKSKEISVKYPNKDIYQGEFGDPNSVTIN